MNDGSETGNHQLASEPQNSCVFEKCSNAMTTVTPKTMAKKTIGLQKLVGKQQL